MSEHQNNSRAAGVWSRAAAFALDYLLILVYLVLIAAIGLFLNSLFATWDWLFSERVRAQAAGFLLVTLPVTLYFAFGESSVRRATWGKAKLRLQVTDVHGGRVRFWRSLARTALKFVPWELSHTLIWTIAFSTGEAPVWANYGFVLVYGLLGLNVASLVLTKRRQAVYDVLARTCVIKQAA